jgi:hypothetical protein
VVEPNLTETDLADLWKFRQEHKDAEEFHQERRRAADKEVLHRAAEADAQVLATDAGDIKIDYSTTRSYNAAVVDTEFYALIERDKLIDQWNAKVRHEYHINYTWLKSLMKRGQEYRDVIDRMTNASTGSPTIKGPALSELGEYVEATT